MERYPDARVRRWPGVLGPARIHEGPLPDAPSPRERIHAVLKSGAVAVLAQYVDSPELRAAAERNDVVVLTGTRRRRSARPPAPTWPYSTRQVRASPPYAQGGSSTDDARSAPSGARGCIGIDMRLRRVGATSHHAPTAGAHSLTPRTPPRTPPNSGSPHCNWSRRRPRRLPALTLLIPERRPHRHPRDLLRLGELPHLRRVGERERLAVDVVPPIIEVSAMPRHAAASDSPKTFFNWVCAALAEVIA